MYIITASISDYIPVAVQILVTAGAIFGSAGFWQWRQAREQAKRDEASKESGLEKKVELLSEKVDTVDEKVDNVSGDVRQMKDDVKLLEQANKEAKKYNYGVICLKVIKSSWVHDWYAKHGYKDFCYDEDTNYVWMKHNLY